MKSPLNLENCQLKKKGANVYSIDLNIETEAICPLCLVDVEPSEKGWKDHLMTGGGCPKLKKTRPLKKPEAKKKTKTVAKTVSKK